MWEAIRSNRRRSWLLLAVMAALLLALGSAIGYFFDPTYGAPIGAVAAAVVWLVLLTVALAQGNAVLIFASGAVPVNKDVYPQLYNVVEEMSIASGLARVPKIYLIEDSWPNAFAMGVKPENAAVAVTTGLLRQLNRDELQGVMAHEIGHISNLDIRFMTIASVMVGSITLISDFFFRSMFFGAGRRRRLGGGKGDPRAQMIMLLVVIVIAVLAPIMAQALYFACSRRREYLADASAARFTRYPPGLASALEKISAQQPARRKVNRALAPMYIVNPVRGLGAMMGLFATHPPVEKRIAVLRAMGGGAGFGDFEGAYGRVVGGRCLGARTLASGASRETPIREAWSDQGTRSEGRQDRAHQVNEALGRLANFIFIPCLCGMTLKIPPKAKIDFLNCPRCGRKHEVPVAEVAALALVGDAVKGAGQPASALTQGLPLAAPAAPLEPLVYHRKGTGWESFKCRCGTNVQISPTFSASFTKCPKCGASIRIRSDKE